MYDHLPAELKYNLFFYNLKNICVELTIEHDITVVLGKLLEHIVSFFRNKNGNFYLILDNKAVSISSIEERNYDDIEISEEDKKKLVTNHFALKEEELSFYPSLSRLNNSKVKILMPLSYNKTLLGFITLGSNINSDEQEIIIAMIMSLVSKIIYYSNNYLDESHKSYNEIYLKTLTDSLSGVYIKSYIEQRMTEGLKESIRYKKPDSFCMVKIDRFEELRKEIGQQNINTLIQTLGNAMNSFLRKDVDLVGKHTEESFLILLPSTKSDGTLVFSEKLKANLDKNIQESHAHQNITVSLAITTLELKDKNKDNIIEKLHEALKNADKNGGNRIILNYQDNVAEVLSNYEKASGFSDELLRQTIQQPVFLLDEQGNEVDFTANINKKWVHIPKNN
ncbi:MAG: GGDEF domain-containing protein [Candidatus Sericytochromatia bacterium]|nr:GGDEF domain-containing protein [Candidatus Sericytochromatia bacterium]